MTEKKHEQTSQYWQQVLAFSNATVADDNHIPQREERASGFEVMPSEVSSMSQLIAQLKQPIQLTTPWLRRLSLAGLVFFAAKGLFWIALGYWVVV
jgi:hypothetical protein